MGRSQALYDRISQSLPVLRGWAITWIVAYHLMGNTKGYLVLEEAFKTLSKGSLKNIVEAGLDLFIEAGSTGVNVFLVISGFGLTASWWKKSGAQGIAKIPLMTFWKKRALRILPHFWAAVAIAILLYFINPAWAPFGQSLWEAGGLSPLWAILTTLTTLRNFISGHFYFLNGAWWYVGLSLQLYLIFPWLIQLGNRYGWRKLLISSLLFSLAYRAICSLSPIASGGVLLPWVFFPSRIFEFSLGIYLAITFLQSANEEKQNDRFNTSLNKLLFKPQFIPICICLFLTGISFKWSTYPALHIFADALIGVGLFGSLIQLSQIKFLQFGQLFRFIGKYSYGIYLTHMNVYLMLWPIASAWIPSYWPRFALVMVVCCAIGIGFEVLFSASRNALKVSFE
ncbi:MAG: acyltransferase [Cyanobacteria bacterium P01_D01_bin.105]